MRLFQHFEYRNRKNSLSDAASKKARLLKSADSWTEHYGTEGDKMRQERPPFGRAIEIDTTPRAWGTAPIQNLAPRTGTR